MKAYVVDSAAVRSNLQQLQTRAGSGVLYGRNAVCLFAGALQLGHKKQILPRGHLRIERR